MVVCEVFLVFVVHFLRKVKIIMAVEMFEVSQVENVILILPEKL